jgi:alpha-beta hydrolase superfamily lysophospholipase
VISLAPEVLMTTEQDQVETVASIGRSADLRAWDIVEGAFTERVVLDYGTPDLLTPQDIVARWRPLLSAFDSTEHNIEPQSIEQLAPNRARIQSTFRAVHRLAQAPGGDTWILRGRYDHELLRDGERWRVSRMRMIPEQSSGNGALLDAARERAHLPAPGTEPFRVEHASFTSEGERVVGVLYLPANAGADARLPAVGIYGTWLSVKEMIVPAYARKLAAAGIAALTIDFRNFGESDGKPRHFESHQGKVADIRASLDFLSSHPRIDPQRLGLVGICAGAGYVAAEAAADPRVRSVALIAPWLHDAPILEATYGGAEGVAAKIRRGQAARAHFESHGEMEYVPAASNSDPNAAMYAPGDTFGYYLDVRRGGIPQWGNRFALMSWSDYLQFDMQLAAPKLAAPTLLVHSEKAAIPVGAHRFAAAMATRPREVWLDGPTQFDFYDGAEVIERASREAIAHLRATL